MHLRSVMIIFHVRRIRLRKKDHSVSGDDAVVSLLILVRLLILLVPVLETFLRVVVLAR